MRKQQMAVGGVRVNYSALTKVKHLPSPIASAIPVKAKT